MRCEICNKEIGYWEYHRNGRWCDSCQHKFELRKLREREEMNEFWRKELGVKNEKNK